MAKTVRKQVKSVPGVGLIYKRCSEECTDTCRSHRWTYQVNNLQRGGRRLNGPTKVLPEGTTRRDAEAALRAAHKAFVAEADKPLAPGNGKSDRQFRDYAAEWLAGREAGTIKGARGRSPMKPTTAANYRMYLDRLDPVLADKPLGRIRARDVSEALRRDCANGKHDFDSATTRRLWTFIRAVLRSANGAVPPEAIDPDQVGAPAEPEMQAVENTWEPEDMEAFLDAAEDERYKAAFMVMLYGGLRRGECCGLRWRDVRFHEDGVDLVVTMTQTVAGSGANRYCWVKPKTNKVRTVSLPPDVADVLRDWKAVQERERAEYGADWCRPDLPDAQRRRTVPGDPDDALFTYPEGYVLRPDHLGRKVKQAIRRAGVPEIRTHDLRDHAAMIMLQSGAFTFPEVAEVLGHSNTRMLSERYARYSDSHRRARAAMLGDYLNRQRGVA